MKKYLLASTIFFALSAFAATAQEKMTGRWHRTAPETEAFTVLMPEPALRVRRSIPFSDELKLPTPVYEVSHAGVLFSVFSIDKTGAPALKTSEDFTSALRHAIRHSSRAGDNEFTFERRVTVNGQTGGQYSVRAKGKKGTAQVYETATHYYVLMTLGVQASDSLASNFFNSFKLDAERARTASDKDKRFVAQEFFDPRTAPQSLWPLAAPESGSGAPAPPIDTDNGNAAAPSARETSNLPAPITGGVLNGKATNKPQPAFPAIARAARAEGRVVVQITVDEEGFVVSARAVSGHPLLQQAAVQAALQARFAPTRLGGKPVKVRGVVTYNFVLETDPSEPPTRKY